MTDAAAAPAPSAVDSGSAPGIAMPDVAESPRPKVKIDGIDAEVDIEDLKRSYQKEKAADKRFQEAAELRRQVDDFVGRASKGDLGWLKGLVPQEVLTQWAEKELLQHIEWQELPEAERRAILAEQRAKEAEERISSFTQTQEREQATALEERAYQQLESDILEVVKDLGGAKATPRLIRRISEQLLADLEASDPSDPQFQPMPAHIAKDRAWKGLEVDALEYLSTLTPEQAIAKLPQKLRDALRRADVATAHSQLPTPQRGRGEQAAPERKKGKRMTTDEYFNNLSKKFKL